MAKAAALAVCILALATFAHCHPEVFDIEGNVYCDPCRVEFETRLSSPIAGATVRLECRNSEFENVTYSIEGLTDSVGHYKLSVKGEHEEDICEISAVKSPREDCNVKFESFEKARISCTENSGIKGDIRYANPLGFMTEKSSSECQEVLEELGLLPVV
ncbi:hypothetical protein M9H77_21725 [Catharanthus roseus]|uniref:Uncharacterized protein n=1 Tax=Catharanthus roseus TaxID=4058 RepID=A0ACC0AQZ1_CATRO|nr:hypothetical protein M9H77_21725 [Catharanthus roseus]